MVEIYTSMYILPLPAPMNVNVILEFLGNPGAWLSVPTKDIHFRWR